MFGAESGLSVAVVLLCSRAASCYNWSDFSQLLVHEGRKTKAASACPACVLVLSLLLFEYLILDVVLLVSGSG